MQNIVLPEASRRANKQASRRDIVLIDEDYFSSSTIVVESFNRGKKYICPTKYRMKIINAFIYLISK
jgi:hypothetical protein